MHMFFKNIGHEYLSIADSIYSQLLLLHLTTDHDRFSVHLERFFTLLDFVENVCFQCIWLDATQNTVRRNRRHVGLLFRDAKNDAEISDECHI